MFALLKFEFIEKYEVNYKGKLIRPVLKKLLCKLIREL